MAALLLFTALTARDVYLGLNRDQNQNQDQRDEAGSGSRAEQGPARLTKTWTNPGSLGPVLRFQFCIS